ncbi:hypothetical protein C4J81_05620 [Deltaproteobacteria bacterium Smac51]|nr:hypothetical protein C4J81_05620 [Deltaproteobacteria bacterium Smac51]
MEKIRAKSFIARPSGPHPIKSTRLPEYTELRYNYKIKNHQAKLYKHKKRSLLMMQMMTPQKGNFQMSNSKKDIIIFNPTPNEFEAVKRHVGAASFRNINPTVIESGMGKINAAFQMAAEVLPRVEGGKKPAVVIGAGTSGSLNMKLTGGDMIVSNAAIIADWRMEDDFNRHCAAYGDINFRAVEPSLAEEMTIACTDPIVTTLLDRLENRGFKRGRMLTSDTFVAGINNKLRLGHEFGCLACDMESAAFGYTASKRLDGIPWFNLRVVADTIDESLSDYVNMEIDMVEILGGKTVEALTILDELLA